MKKEQNKILENLPADFFKQFKTGGEYQTNNSNNFVFSQSYLKGTL